jgi:NhaP-type Na+/H+ or K+/H+ antiporter
MVSSISRLRNPTSSVIDLLCNIAAFVYVGAWMPFSDAFLTLSVWCLVVIGILEILFRRIPIVCASNKWIPDIKMSREVVFSGHFGPLGVGAVFISTLTAQVFLEHINEKPEDAPEQTNLLAQALQPIVAFMVASVSASWRASHERSVMYRKEEEEEPHEGQDGGEKKEAEKGKWSSNDRKRGKSRIQSFYNPRSSHSILLRLLQVGDGRTFRSSPTS